MIQHKITELLKKEIVPVLGCTGPTAYALATASCKPFLTADLQKIKIYVSPAFLKMGFGVASPGTDRPGIEVAAALGFQGGDYKRGLQVLVPCTADDVQTAIQMADSGIIQVLCDEDKDGIYIRAEVTTDRETVEAVVEGTHDGLSVVKVNGKTKFETHPKQHTSLEDAPDSISLDDVFTYIKNVDTKELLFLLDGYHINMELAKDGIRGGFGLGTGRALLAQWWNGKSAPFDLFENPMSYLPDAVAARANILVAAASDARMGGSHYPALAAMGDGNQGITATLPVGSAALLMEKDEDTTIRALALSCLMLFYIKMQIGRASAFCLCSIAASAGAAAGIAYLNDMSEKQIKAAVKNAISPLCGMLCDGAKNACALKMAIATATAFSSVELAAAGVECGFYDGISDDTLEHTVECIARVATSNMGILDRCMVNEIVKKTERRRIEIATH